MNDELRENAANIIWKMAEESDFYSTPFMGRCWQITMASAGEWLVLHDKGKGSLNTFTRFDDLEAALMSIDTKAVGEFVSEYDFFLE